MNNNTEYTINDIECTILIYNTHKTRLLLISVCRTMYRGSVEVPCNDVIRDSL